MMPLPEVLSPLHMRYYYFVVRLMDILARIITAYSMYAKHTAHISAQSTRTIAILAALFIYRPAGAGSPEGHNQPQG